MKILCYGDSNTWGYVPNVDGYFKGAIIKQYNKQDCWWFGLKAHNKVFVDGLCGRSIANENRWLKNRNSLNTIVDDLKQYNNLNLVIVQLGTNDCKTEYNNTPKQITNNLQKLLIVIKEKTNAQIAIISPAIIKEDNILAQKYYLGAQNKSKQLNKFYKKLAQANGYIFISGSNLDVGEDGEHLTLLGHKQLREKLEEQLKKQKGFSFR